MTELLLFTLLFVTLSTGLLSLLYRDLFVSVILLSIFSFLSALLFYVAHAPDVAITEAAVGAGITTFLFIWAVRTTRGIQPGKKTSTLEWGKTIADILIAGALGFILLFLLPSPEEGPRVLRDYLIENAQRETGALNLVSAVYLHYRAFDTFGETIVLLCAVSGALFFLSSKEKKE
jgi:multicomponent Na+:H+ antiporter subunit B